MIQGDRDTYVLAISPDADRFTLVLVGQDRKMEHTVDELSGMKNQLNTIEGGLYDWVSKAIRLRQRSDQCSEDLVRRTEISIDDQVFVVRYDPIHEQIKVKIPGRVVIAKRRNLGDSAPEITFIAEGQLLTDLTDYLVEAYMGRKHIGKEPVLPITFPNPDELLVGGYSYQVAYNAEKDVVFLQMPDRKVEASTEILDQDNNELTVIYGGLLAKQIRKFTNTILDTQML